MGREVKRVPMDFTWPSGELWEGYVNPHHQRCEPCDGSGSTKSSKALEHLVHLLMIAGRNSVERPKDYSSRQGVVLIPNYEGAPPEHHHYFPHPWLSEAGIADTGDTLHELTTGLCGRSPARSVFGHDSMDCWAAKDKIIKAAGLPEDWGWCPVCKGDGIDPVAKAAYEAWQPTDPPAGDGYQLWTTTSEGAPISPVFATPEELATWCETGATTFGDARVTAADWLQMFKQELIVHQMGNAICI